MTNNPSNHIYSIYIITNIINGKQYIGFTSKNPPEKRFKEHKIIIKNTAISRTIQKYGKKNFKFEVILQGWDKDDVLSMETSFIKEFNTLSPNGYNLNIGGAFTIFSENTKTILSDNKKGKKNPMYGKPSPKKGKILSIETRKKISIKTSGNNNPMYGKIGKLNPNYGRKNTEETKFKISKKFLIEFPDGKIKEIIGICNFCKIYTINYGTLFKYSLKNDNWKGFKIIF